LLLLLLLLLLRRLLPWRAGGTKGLVRIVTAVVHADKRGFKKNAVVKKSPTIKDAKYIRMMEKWLIFSLGCL
jgi:hypothetical protein